MSLAFVYSSQRKMFFFWTATQENTNPRKFCVKSSPKHGKNFITHFQKTFYNKLINIHECINALKERKDREI